MHITVNGSATEVDPALSVSGLLDQLALTGKRIAVERNGEVVPKSLHPTTRLAEGDRLEIIVAVGGG